MLATTWRVLLIPVASAATATTAISASPTAAAATITTASAASTTAKATSSSRTLNFRPGLIHIQRSSAQLSSIDGRNCFLAFGIVGHFYEGKAAGLPRVA